MLIFDLYYSYISHTDKLSLETLTTYIYRTQTAKTL